MIATASEWLDYYASVVPSGVRSVYDDALRGHRLYLELVNSPIRLKRFTRFTPEQYEALLERLDVRDGREITAGQKLVIFLNCVATGRSIRDLQEVFHHSGSTISMLFHEVLQAVVRQYRSLVLERGTDRERAESAERRTEERGMKYWPWFKDAVGALDGSHVHAFVKHGIEPAPWRNRKGFLSQNVLAVVDFDRCFTFVLPGWEGSAHDGRVLASARADHGLTAPLNKYYLADAGYSNSAITMVPYRGVRYHLREVQEVSLRPQTPQELFNLRHSVLRNVVERTFGIFKGRFQILLTAPPFSMETQVKLIYALAALHNFLTSTGGDDGEEPVEVDERDGGPLFGNRPTEKDASGMTAMAQRREAITEEMWVAYEKELQGRSNPRSVMAAGGFTAV